MNRFSFALVTGGAGFIGSHLVDRLMETGCSVRVVDNLSAGRLENLKDRHGCRDFEFVDGDLKDLKVAEKAVNGVEVVFHLAANPEVRVAEADPSVHFDENLLTTFNILEALRKKKSGKLIVFFSSSTVYGEPNRLPTSEDYGPLLPISVYGASKLGCEALVSAYSHTFGVDGLIFRLANIVGGRSDHGVIADFVNKLRKNPDELEILGDGRQCKSYLHVSDCVSAVLFALNWFQSERKSLEVYNLGSTDRISVKRIAEIVRDEMGLNNLRFKFTGGIDGGRGWKGDVKIMLLSSDKMASLGWRSRLNSEEAVEACCRELLHKQTERNSGTKAS